MNTVSRRDALKTIAIGGSSILTANSLLAATRRKKDKLGVALIGLGYYSTDLLAPALQKTKNCYLAGIVTGTPSKAEAWKKQYNIPTSNFIGHADIAPTRKNDPNIYFPWKRLADSGYGNWYDDTTNIILPSSFNAMQALRIIGYNIKDTTAATIAFKRHWLQDTFPVFDSAQYKVLFQVMKKYE